MSQQSTAFLTDDLPLLRDATALRCEVRQPDDRLRVKIVVTRTSAPPKEHFLRVNPTLWRGLLLPALRHLAAYNAVPFAVTGAVTTTTGTVPIGD